MNEPVSEHVKDLIDAYLGGSLDENQLAELDQCLRADEAARRYFVRYARLETDLHLEVRAQQAGTRAMARIEGQSAAGRPARRARRRLAARLVAAAAAVVLLVGGGLWLAKVYRDSREEESAVAWLVNAQNCTWAEGEPTGDLRAGKVLKVERGLAEIRFRCGARVVLEGPARLVLLSDKSARLEQGKLSARAPAGVTGFTILSPRGKVIDLGTEFAVAVGDDGATDVYVFEGKVEAQRAAKGWGAENASKISLIQNQAARISDDGITLRPAGPDAGQFVRAIVAPPTVRPRVLEPNFDRPGDGGILDANGVGTGLTHRLPGTGARLPERDPNLRMDPAKGRMELTTTNNDINTQFRLFQGEYVGARLADLGFTGSEDFAVTATILDIPALEFVGQFGLYAGTRSDENIRGGVISVKGNAGEGKRLGQYTQFLVNDHKGRDADLCEVGLLSTGTDLRLTLKRVGGKYSLTVENLTDGSASTVTIRHPDFLDGERDLYVGLFAANPRSDVHKTLIIKNVSVTVWTVLPAAEANRPD
jgi:ferric-dicitrate binding protein FerR (iron transport regulator)